MMPMLARAGTIRISLSASGESTATSLMGISLVIQCASISFLLQAVGKPAF
jgi:hypothetical protein